MSNVVFFSVKSGLKDIIGRDLILEDNIAIFELVKNSYDAHAKNVIITFEKNKIIIADDGKGMSYKDITDKWLSVAWSAKDDGSEDLEDEEESKDEESLSSYRDLIQEKRYYAGAKGIGRFSADRLGEKLTLTTCKRDLNKIEQLDVNWGDFNKKLKQDFEKIPVVHKSLSSYKIHFPNDSKSGTILEIEGITNWNRNKIKDLKHSLEKLINPFSETEEFSIEIICLKEKKEDDFKLKDGKPKYVERDKINGVIKNSIVDVIKLKTTHLELVALDDKITTKLYDRGTLIYHIEEKNRYNPFIDNLKIDLYYLNRSAKINFGKIMGIPPVQYGSVFLFKNGFRVQPYGEKEDDSWGLDSRSQQGYNRYLSSRDLFGRVDIITENSVQFNEVSSRDGGLKKTAGYFQLQNAFKENGLKRLERYVAGVLWGEAFIRNKYFKSNKEAHIFRQALLEKDKDSDDFSIAKSNIGSKIDFIKLIKSLADNKELKIIAFNKDLVDTVNENLEEVQDKFVADLRKIADATGDEELSKKVDLTQEAFLNLEKEKIEAEQKAKEEEQKRLEAERKAKEEEQKRLEAERKAKEEEDKRKKAELEAAQKEKDRLKAENDKLKAELKAKEEEEKRLIAERKAKEEEEGRKKAEELAEKRGQQIKRSRAAETIEYKDLRDSNHIIGVYSDDISKKLLLTKRNVDKGQVISNKELLDLIKGVSFANEKISTITRFTTKSNFLEATLERNEDIINYIKVYIEDIYTVLYHDVPINVIDNGISLVRKFEPIELSMAIDNILSNSRKKKASEIILEFSESNDTISLSFKDIGLSLDSSISDYNLIFEEGITTTKGSGLGLSHVKRIVENNLKGKIEYNPNYKKGFELIITF